MERFHCDAVVIGAGAVGLAVARQLALAGHDVVILEKNAHPGMETSARNSEVIHAGIYYPQGSRKAQFCARGKALLYDFCVSHGVPHKRIGKLIVGHAGQEAQLDAMARAASDNDVNDLQPLDQAQIAALEPAITADIGLFSPSTGILDSHQYMLALLGDLTLVRNAQVGSIARESDGWRLDVTSDDEDIVLESQLLVNAAGLWAQSVAARIAGLKNIPALHLAKGNYAGLSVKAPFHHLVDPVPEPGGLGPEVDHQLRPQDAVGEPREVLDRGGEHQLPAGLVAGGRRLGLKHGQHLAFDPDKHPPLSNLLLTVAQKMGVRSEKFADGRINLFSSSKKMLNHLKCLSRRHSVRLGQTCNNNNSVAAPGSENANISKNGKLINQVDHLVIPLMDMRQDKGTHRPKRIPAYYVYVNPGQGYV